MSHLFFTLLQQHTHCNLHASYCMLNGFPHCLCAESAWMSVCPTPPYQTPPPRLVAQLVWDQRKSRKQPMKRVMLRMTPSLNYSVFYTKRSLACCRTVEGYTARWCLLLLSHIILLAEETSKMFNRWLNKRGFIIVLSSSSLKLRLIITSSQPFGSNWCPRGCESHVWV